jgi:CheY-like chemotaxis protein
MSPKRPRALVLDDDRSTLLVVSRALEGLGLNPIACSSPTVALQIVEDNAPLDIIVTDYQMPEMNGEQFLQRLAGTDLLPTKGVIMTSGVISLPEINRLLSSGVDYFLPKPVNLKELCGYVNRALQSRGVGHDSAGTMST